MLQHFLDVSDGVLHKSALYDTVCVGVASASLLFVDTHGSVTSTNSRLVIPKLCFYAYPASSSHIGYYSL